VKYEHEPDTRWFKNKFDVFCAIYIIFMLVYVILVQLGIAPR